MSGAFSGAGSVTKEGDGTLVLSGTKTHTGMLILSEGVLIASSDAHLGASGATLNFDGGTLKVPSSFASSKKSTLVSTGAINVAPSKTLTMSGVLSGGGDLSKAGEGVLILSGTNTFSGDLTLNLGTVKVDADGNLGASSSSLNFDGGVLNIASSFSSSRSGSILSSGVIDVDPNQTFTMSGALSGTGSLTKKGEGRLNLSGANSFSGGIALFKGILSVSGETHLGASGGNLAFEGGTLNISSSFTSARNLSFLSKGVIDVDASQALTLSGPLSGGGDLTKKGQGTLRLSGSNPLTGETLIDGGVLELTQSGSLESSPLKIDGGSLAIEAGSGTKKLKALSGGGGGIALSDNILEVASGTFSGVISGTGSLQKKGVGTLTLSGANTYTGPTNLSEGILSVSGDNQLGGSGSTLSFDGGTLQATSSFVSSRNGSISSTSAIDVLSSKTVEMSGVLSGVGKLIKEGSGTLELSGVNLHSGGIGFSAGVVRVDADNQLGASQGGLDFDGGALEITTSLSTQRAVLLSSTGILTINPNQTVTMGGVISGNGSLTKKGAGELVLSGVNKFLGGLILSEGTAQVSNDYHLGGTPSGLLFDGGTLNITASFTSQRNTSFASDGLINVDPNKIVTLSGILSGPGGLKKGGGGSLVLSGSNTYLGKTTLVSGVLSFSSDQNLGNPNSPLDLEGGIATFTNGFTSHRVITLKGGEIEVSGTPLRLSGVLGGTAALKKKGGGTLVLGGANTYTGGVNLLDGALSVSSDANLGGLSSNLTFDGGSLITTQGFSSARDVLFSREAEIDVNGGSLTLSGILSGSGDLKKKGSGILILTGANNSHTGKATIHEGTLQGRVDTLPLEITNNDFVAFDVPTDATYDGVITGSGALIKEGAGTLTISDENSFTGGTIVRGGKVVILTGARLMGSNIDFEVVSGSKRISRIEGDGFLKLNSFGVDIARGNFAGVISGQGGKVKKTGTRLLVLSGSNTYTGGTTINGGKITLSADENLGHASGGVEFNGGVLNVSSGFSSSRAISLKGQGTVQVDQGSLTLSGIVSGAGLLIKSGAGTLVLSGSNTNSGGVDLIDGRLSLSSNQNLGSSGSNLRLSGGTLEVTSSFNLTKNLLVSADGTILVNPGLSLEISGLISGSKGIKKEGTGTLKLSGVNTYSGVTTIEEGILELVGAGTLGSGKGLNVLNGASFAIAAGAGNKKVSLLSGGGAGIDLNDNQLEISDGSFSGVIRGSGGMLKYVGTDLVLSGTNTYTGGTIVDTPSGLGKLTISKDAHLGATSAPLTLSGHLVTLDGFSSSRAISLAAHGGIISPKRDTLTLSGVISGSAPLTKKGGGTLVLSGSNTNSGSISIEEGTLSVGTDQNLGRGSTLILDGGVLEVTSSFASSRNLSLASPSGLSVASSQTFRLSGPISGVGSLEKEGAGTLKLSGVNSYSGGTTIDGGVLELAGSGTLGGGSLAIQAGRFVIEAGAGTKRVSTLSGGGGGINLNENRLEVTEGAFSGSLVGTGGLDKKGGGTLILSGASTYSGGTKILGGIVSISQDQNLGRSGSAVEFNGGALAVTSGFSSSRTLSLSGDGTIEVSGSSPLTLYGVVSGSGLLTKKGSGRLVLNGTNTNSGGIVLSDGVLSLSSDANLGSTLSGLTFDGGSLLATAGFSSAKNFRLTKVAKIEVQSSALTLSGVLSGSGSLKKEGSGTLVLSGENSYSGGTTLSDGVLRISSQKSLGGGPSALDLDGGTLEVGASFVSLRGLSLSSSGIIDVDPNETYEIRGLVSGGGTLEKKGGGTLALSGLNIYTGGVKLSEGMLKISSDRSLGASGSSLSFKGGDLRISASLLSARDFSLSSSATIDVDADQRVTLVGTLSGAGGLKKRGAGTLHLSGDNTYSGGTTLSGGMLTISQESNLGSGNLLFDGGDLGITGSFVLPKGLSLSSSASIDVDARQMVTLSSLLSGAGGLKKKGEGTLTLSSVNTYSGGTTLSQGTVRVSKESNLGASRSSLTFDGGTLEITSSFASSRGVILSSMGRIDVDSGQTYEVSETISGAGLLKKGGKGILKLSKVNTYSGGTTIDEGDLILTRSGSLSSSGVLTIKDGGRLAIESGAGVKKVGTLNGEGRGIHLNDATLELADGSFSGVIVGNSGSLKCVGSDLTLSGMNTYGGGTIIETPYGLGRVNISKDQNLGASSGGVSLSGYLVAMQGFASSRNITLNGMGGGFLVEKAPLTLSGVIDGSASLTKGGVGTLVLEGTNTYTGGTVLSEGALSVGSDAHLGGIASLTFDGGALIVRDGFSSTRAVTFSKEGTFSVNGGQTLSLSGSLSSKGGLIKEGEGFLELTSSSNTYAGMTVLKEGVLVITSDRSLGDPASKLEFNGGTLQLSGVTSSRGILLTGSGEINVAAPGSVATFSGLFEGDGTLTKSGDGTLVLSGMNTYKGKTTVDGGILRLSSDQNLGDPSASIFLNGGSLLLTQSLLSSRPISLLQDAPIEIKQGSVGLSGILSGSGTLIKKGDGTLVLSGDNTYSGGTKLLGGLLSVSSNTNLGSSNSPLIFDGGSLLASQGFVSSRNLSFVSGAEIGVSKESLTLSGLLSGKGFLTKKGSGTLILSGTNTYTGGTTIQEGTLAGNASTLPLSLTNNGYLLFDEPVNATYNGIITGSGSLIKEGRGTLFLTGRNTFTGKTIIREGSLKTIYPTAGALHLEGGQIDLEVGSGTQKVARLTGGGSIKLEGDGAVEVEEGIFSGTISGEGGVLKKGGSGLLVLKRKNSYGGGTRLEGGTISVGSDEHLGESQGELLFNGGKLLAREGFVSRREISLAGQGEFEVEGSQVTLEGSISGGGVLKKSGKGTLVLKGVNSGNGGIDLAEGTLRLFSAGSLGSDVASLSLSGGTLEVASSFELKRGLSLGAPSALKVGKAGLLRVSGVISGAHSITKEGEGVLTLSAVNTYTGDTVVDKGTLELSGSGTLGAGGSLNLNDALFRMNGGIGSREIALLNGEKSQVELNNNELKVKGGAFAGVISGQGGVLEKSGSQRLTLSGINTYTGGTKLNGGGLSISSDENLGEARGGLIFDGGILLMTKELTSQRGILLAGEGTFDVSTTPVPLLSSSPLFDRVDDFLGGLVPGRALFSRSGEDERGAVTLAGKIDGRGALKKEGEGTLILKGKNTFSGGIDLLSGTLRPSSDENLGSSGSILRFRGGVLEAGASFVCEREASLLADAILRVGSQRSLEMKGEISGSGSLKKEGMGNLRLSETNTYLGETHIYEGIIELVEKGTLGAGGDLKIGDKGFLRIAEGIGVREIATLSGGGHGINLMDNTLELSGGDFSGVISGRKGILKKLGSGLLSLSAANTYGGGTVINGGKILVSSDAQLGDRFGGITLDGGTLFAKNSFATSRGLSLAGSGILEVDAGELTLNGTVTGKGVLIKSGKGVLVLEGTNRATGGINLREGTLRLFSERNFSSDLTFDGGRLEVMHSLVCKHNISLPSDALLDVAS